MFILAALSQTTTCSYKCLLLQHWKEASKLLLSKHQQTQLLEAAAILTATSAGSSLPDEKSYWYDPNPHCAVS